MRKPSKKKVIWERDGVGYYQGLNTSVILISEEMQYFKKFFFRGGISRSSRAILSVSHKICLCPADGFCLPFTEFLHWAFLILSLGEDWS